MSPIPTPTLRVVCCATSAQILQQRLLASPCLGLGGLPLTVYFNAHSAAQGFNAALAEAQNSASDAWLVWVHQDVLLPPGWDSRFTQALAEALQRWPALAVAGVYGVLGQGAQAQRAGHVLDRGRLLHEALELPCLVDSLDELLFAVRVRSGLRLDAQLGFDFYATDLVLQAQQAGWCCAVLDAYCEHWSSTPASGAIAATTVQRIAHSADVFEAKWAHRLPLTTPCFHIEQPGDVQRFLAAVVTPVA